MTSVGVDLVEIERIESAIKRWRERFLNRIYTEAVNLVIEDKIRIAGRRVVLKK